MRCARIAARGGSKDRGAMQLMTMTKLVVALGIVGVGCYDTVACMADHTKTEDHAQDAAYAGSDNYITSKNIYSAYDAAVAALKAEAPDDTLIRSSFTVDSDGTVHLMVTRTAKTVVAGKIGFLKHLTVATEEGDANALDSK
jgi:hypothetical protein